MPETPFPYTIPKTGKPIISQEDLITDLTIALWLIEKWSTTSQREQGAKIMIELMTRPIEAPADRLSAMTPAKQNIWS